MPAPRPVSPFLILLLGGAATALATEWLRFGWGPLVAAAPAVLGTVATLTGTARAYRARRAWRRAGRASAQASAAEAAAAASALVDADDDGNLRIRRLEGAAVAEPRSASGAPGGAASGAAETAARPARTTPADVAAHEPSAPRATAPHAGRDRTEHERRPEEVP